MNHGLSFTAYKALAKESKFVAVHHVFSLKNSSASAIYEKLSPHFGPGIIIEKKEHPVKTASTYFAFSPLCTLKASAHTVEKICNSKVTHFTEAPFKILRDCLKEFSYAAAPCIRKVLTQAAGYISYDAKRSFEKIDSTAFESQCLDFVFDFFRISISLDQGLCFIAIISDSSLPAANNNYANAIEEIKLIIALLDSLPDSPPSLPLYTAQEKMRFECSLSDEAYCCLVSQVKKYIHEGDAFQLVCFR